MNKSNKIKTNGIKRFKHVTVGMVADTVGCSKTMVHQVWSGERRAEKKKGEAIEVATLLLNECVYEGIKKAREIIGVVQNE
ncbi:MAG: hypothetical protein LC096_08360 [Bacteroidia bacterium]|nr:hypothetical protein [Bacteroidia bacterium]